MRWSQRFLELRGHYAFHATACTPATPREKGSVEAAVRHLKTNFWLARRFASLSEFDDQYAAWREEVCNRRRHATGRFPVAERLRSAPGARALPPGHFDFAGRRPARVPLDGYLRHGGCFCRDPEELAHQRVELRFDPDSVWISHRGDTVARYRAQLRAGCLASGSGSAPRAAGAGSRGRDPRPEIAPPELSDYAALCA